MSEHFYINYTQTKLETQRANWLNKPNDPRWPFDVNIAHVF